MQTLIPQQKIDCHNFVIGAWVKGDGGTFSVTSPYNGKVIGEVSVPSLEQIRNALAAAGEKQIAWGKTPAKERAQVLFQFRNILLRDADAISHLKSAEC
jgi:acyl-CoA reductase-like NAD-dependent aldehyde dehydrogenase